MKLHLHPNWKLSPREATHEQERLRDAVQEKDGFTELRYVAGADMAFDPETDEAFAGVIVYELPDLREVERRMVRQKLQFPYVPGLLSFREGPALVAAFRKLRTEPDVILIDGHGRAHPRLFGIACHIGLIFEKPTIGCAKSLLVGEHSELGEEAGSSVSLTFKGQEVGIVLRTRTGVKPIYVTVGHLVSLPGSVTIVSQCLDGLRIPKPTREADHYVGALRQAYQEEKRKAGEGKTFKGN